MARRANGEFHAATESGAKSLMGSLSRLRGSHSIGAADTNSGSPATSSISSDFVITGNISCKGKAQFDGEVYGNIECSHLIVGKNGRIKGDIKAEDAVIFGQVEGAIHCEHVALKSGAHVVGDVFHNGLAIEMGASFLGRSGALAQEPPMQPGAEARNVTPTNGRAGAATPHVGVKAGE